MPKLTVEGSGTVDVGANRRLVLGIEQDAHVDIMHACGGFARCTTCRVEFIHAGVRLSCQILCDHDMTVRPVMRFAGSGRADPGPTPQETITPPAEWID
jgi:ferredoxin